MFRKRTKKRLPEIGKNLVGFALNPDDIESATDELAPTIAVDKTTVEHELRFLRIFAVDFGITLGLPGKQKEKEIVSAFYFRTLDSFVEDLPSELKEQFMIDLERKFDSYGLTMKQNTTDDPFNAIGKLFSNHCGLAHSDELADYGKHQFIVTANGVSDYLKNIEIIA
jgi:hypothetical protein